MLLGYGRKRYKAEFFFHQFRIDGFLFTLFCWGLCVRDLCSYAYVEHNTAIFTVFRLVRFGKSIHII